MIYSKHEDQDVHELKVELISNNDTSDHKPCHGNCKNCRKNQNNKTTQIQDLYRDFLSNL